MCNLWLTKEQLKIAKNNGIKYNTLYNRVYNYGWSIEDAITKQPHSIYSKRKSKLYTREEEEIMIANGVSTDLFRNRLWRGWNRYDAMNIKNLGRGKNR